MRCSVAMKESTNVIGSGSNGTQHSNASTGGPYDSSSARYSSTSTLPSIETPSDDYTHAHPRPAKSVPMPQQPATTSSTAPFLRSAGRAFTFGSKKTEPLQGPVRPPVEPPPHYDIPDIPAIRHRAMTETSYASASTATPPKLLDNELDFGGDGDDFSNIFAGIGEERRRSRALEPQANHVAPSTVRFPSVTFITRLILVAR